MKLAPVTAIVALGWPAVSAAAVVFPPDTAYRPLHCAGAPMTDPYQDQTGFFDDLDVVGDVNAPAALRASDATNLYLRLRLDQDPAPAGVVHASSWGMEFDLDGDLSTYELLILVDGIAPSGAVVSLFTNHTTTVANDPSDPADQPEVVSYPFAMNARSIVAAGSMNGGDADYFLDFAVPWSELTPVGLDHTTATHVWAASSSAQDALNGDFACQDGRTGPAHLDVFVSDPTTGDPANDTGSTGELEGGGGCSIGGSGAGAGPLLALALLGLRRRRAPR